MHFDFNAFAKNIDYLRELYREANSKSKIKVNRGNLGTISSENNTDSSWPKAYFLGGWYARSNHEKLSREHWDNQVAETFTQMHKALRSIPAFDHSEITWSIEFLEAKATKRVANPPPAYRIQIMDAKLTDNFVKTSTSTIKVLKQIVEDVAPVVRPKPVRRFMINGTYWPSASDLDVARTYAALHNPSLLGDRPLKAPYCLPAIREILDTTNLLNMLRA